MRLLTKRLLGLLLAAPVLGFEKLADCVPGGIVGSLKQTEGKVGFYTKALQQLLPKSLGGLALLASGPLDECDAAADAINLNKVELTAVGDSFPEMQSVNMSEAFDIADKERAYLYVFHNMGYVPHLADCVPGSVVRSLDKTEGTVFSYVAVLKVVMPGVYGDYIYIGKGSSSSCLKAMNAINTAAPDAYDDLKKGGYDMTEMSVVDSLAKADDDETYLYVLHNQMLDEGSSAVYT